MTKKPETTSKAVAVKADLAKDTKTLRAIPKIKTGKGKGVDVVVASEDTLRELFGVRTREAGNGLYQTLINALGNKGALYRDLASAMPAELEPKDAIEGMLIAQMTATHVAMMTAAGKFMDAEYLQQRNSHERAMNRCAQTFTAQMDALKRYRAKAQRAVRVEQVTVNDGGQAIVGNVEQRGN